MRNLTKKLALTILITGVTLLTSCEEKNKDVEIKGIKGNVDLKNTDDIEKMVPNQIISINQAVEMKGEYDSSILPLIEKAKSTKENEYQATEFAYIDLDSLKKYIAFIEKVESLNEMKISGLRFYFAAYPNQNKFATVDKATKYLGRETFFIAPTMEIEETEQSKKYPNLKHVPFEIISSSDNKYIGTFEPINNLFSTKNSMNKTTNSKNSSNINQKRTENTSLILNELNLTPPPKK